MERRGNIFAVGVCLALMAVVPVRCNTRWNKRRRHYIGKRAVCMVRSTTSNGVRWKYCPLLIKPATSVTCNPISRHIIPASRIEQSE
jgi:hypothetical protein